MRNPLALTLLLLLGCPKDPVDDTAPLEETAVDVVDMDEDGYPEGEDCNDRDASINPGAEELCDSVDNDCDGDIDEDLLSVFYVDADGDGYGLDASAEELCEASSGWVELGGDCDDTRDDVYPGAEEPCDGADNDCDGETDEEGDSTWYRDADGDGYGDPAESQEACAPGPGWAASDDDCDDSRAEVYPEATEVCDGLDNDCDGAVDEDVTTTYYADADADGYGDETSTTQACDQPSGYVSGIGDCDDSDPAVNPDGTEVCNEADDDCDGTVDEGVTTTFYADADADGYGDESSTTQACDQPAGFVSQVGDCDDGNAALNPAAAEFCDGFDNDCDGTTDNDDAVDADTWYPDGDGDGYGDGTATTVTSCSQPAGYAGSGDDCDDGDAGINPAATELCDSVDNDCDGTVDNDSATDAATWYVDDDGDGYGAAGTSDTMRGCDQPAGYAATTDDCADDDFTVSPAATEVCDGLDNDCDGLTDFDDPGVADAVVYYADADADGFGDASGGAAACEQPSGTVTVAFATDCDDLDSTVNPDADEVCDGIDNDCDGLADDADDDVVDPSSWYTDADADGFGDPGAEVLACVAPSGTVTVAFATDCDDGNAAANPDEDEVCDGVDNDCDGDVDIGAIDEVAFYFDGDGDGYGDPSDVTLDCSPPTGFVADSSDCADGDAAVNPAASEVCDGVDNDCNGLTDFDDPGVTDAVVYYTDGDGDGYGDASTGSAACEQSSGTVTVDMATDCDDTDAGISPVAGEACDGVDNDCDGLVDDADSALVDPSSWYSDADGDSFGDAATEVQACLAPSGTVSDSSDCDDSDGAVNPDADEYCDGIDNDCDGGVDVGALDVVDFYFDGDGDGYGDAADQTWDCSVPTGFVADSTDCDDGDAAINPGATETCSGADLDCDGVVPPMCATCAEHLVADPTALDGLYFADLDGTGTGHEVWCDMSTDGGGWTLVQRTLWDWGDSVELLTGWSEWLGSTLGDPNPGTVYRMAGELWTGLNVELDHLVVHVARDSADESDCDPLFYQGNSGAFTISTTDAEITGLVSAVTIMSDTFLSTTDSGPHSSCTQPTSYGVPWFYGGCCLTCPTFKGGSWTDEPHPMALYLDTDSDEYGNIDANVCPSGAAEKNVGGTGTYEAVNVMEYYLR